MLYLLTLSNEYKLSSSIENLSLDQYTKLFEFIIRQNRRTELLSIIKLDDRLTKMVESTEECTKEDNLLIQSLKKASTNQDTHVFKRLQNILQSNTKTNQPMLVAIKKNDMALIETLLPYQSIDEKSLSFWKMCLSTVCECQNTQILELLSKNLRKNEDQSILSKLLKAPLGKDQKRTALFYTIDHAKQDTDISSFISCCMNLGVDLSEKLKEGNMETPLLYALSHQVGLSTLKPLITQSSLSMLILLNFFYTLVSQKPLLGC